MSKNAAKPVDTSAPIPETPDVGQEAGDPTKLNARQLRFIDEYLIDLNASAAAVRAGYSKNGCGVTGYRLLSHPVIHTIVKSRQADMTFDLTVTAERVLKSYALMAFDRTLAPRDRKAALDSICKMLGYNAADKVEVSGEKLTPEDRVARIKDLLQKGSEDASKH